MQPPKAHWFLFAVLTLSSAGCVLFVVAVAVFTIASLNLQLCVIRNNWNDTLSRVHFVKCFIQSLLSNYYMLSTQVTYGDLFSWSPAVCLGDVIFPSLCVLTCYCSLL